MSSHAPERATLDPWTMAGRTRSQRFTAQVRAAPILLTLGLVLVFLFADTVLECEREGRATPACSLERRVLQDRLTLWTLAIDELHSAGVRELVPQQGKSAPNYQVILGTDRGDRRMNWMGHKSPAEAVVAAVEAYLSDPRTASLVVDLRLVGFARVLQRIGFGLVAIGILYLLSLPFTWKAAPSSRSSGRSEDLNAADPSRG